MGSLSLAFRKGRLVRALFHGRRFANGFTFFGFPERETGSRSLFLNHLNHRFSLRHDTLRKDGNPPQSAMSG
jgi:hypothetical protein